MLICFLIFFRFLFFFLFLFLFLFPFLFVLFFLFLFRNSSLELSPALGDNLPELISE